MVALAMDTAIVTKRGSVNVISLTMETQRAANALRTITTTPLVYVRFISLLFLRNIYISITDCTDDETCNGHGHCYQTGQCVCDTPHSGNATCGQCAPDYFNYPDCTCILISI